MTVEQLLDKMSFEERPLPGGGVNVVGELTLRGVRYVHASDATVVDKDQMLARAREALRRQLLRALYEDQSRALYEALMKVLVAHPFDGNELFQAKEELIKAARHQPPLDWWAEKP